MRTDLVKTGRAGADYEVMRDKLLDRYNMKYGILAGEEIVDVSTLANPHCASALARAYNDWVIDTWLPLDKRFKISMFVAPQDPQGAAAEIRRIGEHPDVVQVMLSAGSYRPYGDPIYHPIAVHLGGQGGVNYNPIGSGPTTYYMETHTLLCQPGMTHVTSAIVQGVFERWPDMYLARYVYGGCRVWGCLAASVALAA